MFNGGAQELLLHPQPQLPLRLQDPGYAVLKTSSSIVVIGPLDTDPKCDFWNIRMPIRVHYENWTHYY